ncbi:hypothetical protein PVL29_001301 [Vitis rotundifolia]|uniref:Uncharacterized protein n=1 Tax=Vitis rotundifolia TaxID=103349 RepID=A0AA39ALG8_VITRO|nr:hypothetical protein PVL29_001301 [Vitis rotundifolia]
MEEHKGGANFAVCGGSPVTQARWVAGRGDRLPHLAHRSLCQELGLPQETQKKAFLCLRSNPAAACGASTASRVCAGSDVFRFFSEIKSVECEEEEIGGIDGGSLVDGGGEVEESVGRPSGRGVTMAVLKMLVVVILALGTKKLAVGITMFAFLLLFLEYAAKWVFGLLTPCSDAQIAIKSLIPKAPIPRTPSNASVEEIQIAESQFVG